MQFLLYFAYVYLGIGFLYATYILLFAGDPWYAFPVNMIGFPFYFIKVVIKAYRWKPPPSFKDLFENKKVIVFDLDGTLIDSKEFWRKAIREVGSEEDMYVSDSAWSITGLGLEEKWKKIIEDNDMEKLVDPSEMVEKTENKFLELLPEDFDVKDGFWPLAGELKQDRKAKLVLASNTNRRVVDKLIKRLDLEGVFDLIIGGDEVKNKKPDPEIYKKVVKEMGVKSKNILVFEDSIAGSEAASKANMDMIIIWDVEKTRDWYPKEARIYLPDFSSLPGNLDKTYQNMLEESSELIDQGLVEI